MSTVETTASGLRRFTRFFTRRTGVLGEQLLGGPLSPTECRVIYEIAHQPGSTARDLAQQLDLDPGYLSRLLRGLEDQRLVARRASETDGRQSLLALTETGRALLQRLDAQSQTEAATMVAGLSEAERGRLTEALATIEDLLGARPAPARAIVIRPHRIGDIGWVIHRHGVLYAEEYGWDITFEALVAGIGAELIAACEARRATCLIAEQEGRIVGSASVMLAEEGTAKLRLVYVEPFARGQRIGRRLVEEAVAYARGAGCRRMTLWTNDVLVAARRLYETEGFTLVAREPHESFGRTLVGEIWTREI